MEILQLVSQAMAADQSRLSTIAANIANARTPGYKREIAQTAGFEARMDAMASVASDWRAGALQYTGRNLDVALTNENQFFEVSRDGALQYARQGAFHLDSQGRLVNNAGDAVMGQGGEIRLQSADVRVDQDGTIYEQGRRIDTLSIISFKDPGKLQRLPSGGFDAAGQRPVVTEQVAVKQGFIEASNVDSAKEMVALVDVMRHFESLQKTTQFVDEMTGRAIQKLGEF